jgi:hypothetical protein
MPCLYELLGNTNSDVRSTTVSLLEKMIDRSESRPNIIVPTLTCIVPLSDAIGAVLLSLFQLLGNTNAGIRSTAVFLLEKLAARRELHQGPILVQLK